MVGISISSQSEFQKARSALQRANPDAGRKSSFCYLCGNALPPLGERGRKTKVHVEHIIPQAVCGDDPIDPKDRWRPTAVVHLECDKKYKSNLDQFYNSYTQTVTNDPEQWNAKQAKEIRNHLGEILLLENGETIGTISNANAILDSVWHWVRGFHSLIHSSFLPENTHKSMSSPVRMFADSNKFSKEQQFETQKETRSICAQVCYRAKQVNKLNEFRCWNNRIEFASAWTNIERIKSRRASSRGPICCWMLNVPGLSKWSLTDSQEPLPWCGTYGMRFPPKIVAYLNFADINLDLPPVLNAQECAYEVLPSLNPS